MSEPKVLQPYRLRSGEGVLRPVRKWDWKFVQSTMRSTVVKGRTERKAVSEVNCVACGDSIRKENAIQASCGHIYDPLCLKRLFLLSLRDASMMPPRCCKFPIAFEKAEPYLKEQTRIRFRKKERQLADPHPLYCSNVNCGQWIPPERINPQTKTGICPRGHKTCTTCQKAAHKQVKECAGPVVDATTLALIVAQGWKRCDQCKIFVERTEGCLHITCRCGHQFCYACTRPWELCYSACKR